MTNDYPRLCGGTFFTLLLQARKQRTKPREHRKGERDGLAETDMLVGLLKVFNPDYIEPIKETIGTFKTKTSEFKSCKISNSSYLPFEEISPFNDRVRREYAVPLKEMCVLVDSFIEVSKNSEKDIRLVRALLELIHSDQSIPDEQIFYVGKDGCEMTKATLKNVADVFLPSFLLGIWHFVLLNRKDNTVGKATYDNWCPPKAGAERKYIGKIGESITQTIKLTTRLVTDADVEDAAAIDGEREHLPRQDVSRSLEDTTEEIKKSLVDVFEDAIDIYDIAAFVDADFTAEKLYFDAVIDVGVFIEQLRNTLREFRRNQNSTYRNIIDFISMIEQYIGYMSARMICDDGVVCHWLSRINWSDVHKDTHNYRNKLNNLYGLISNGGSLSVFGYATPEENEISAETVEIEVASVKPVDDVDSKRFTVNNHGTVQNQKFISIETMGGDINL